MAHVVMVLRAEDAVLDFLSVLGGLQGEDVHVALAGPRRHLVLPASAPLHERVAALAVHVAPAEADAGGRPADPEELRALLAEASPKGETVLWTHSPADNRRTRRRLGREAARVAPGADIRHAVGYQPYLQLLSDSAAVLPASHAAAKLDFVNRHCGHLLACRDPQYCVDTGRAPSIERFFRSDDHERARLYALTASMEDDAATVTDPWDFQTSAYEAERLDATASWVARHQSPHSGRVVEVGACEGALTRRLTGRGFHVDATEPNALFRARLEALRGERTRVHPHDLAALCSAPLLPADAYLLIEMLYGAGDPVLLDRLPAPLLFLALEPANVEERLVPWLRTTGTWLAVDEVELVAPRLELVCAGRAYLRKRGSRGVVVRRRSAR